MGAMSRTKGKRGELEVVRIFKDHDIDAERSAPMQAGNNGHGDVKITVPGFHIESKMQGRICIVDWMRQVERDASPLDVPVVAWRLCSRQASTGWYANLPLNDFAVMVRRGAL